MASRTRCITASGSGDLPLDALREILLRLSAKELCRLRVVSPAWQSITYDPTFIAAHKARHLETLLAFAYNGDYSAYSVDVVDLSGKLVRRMPSERDGHFVLRNRLDLVCVACRYSQRSLWVLNPATGATLALPQCHSEYTGDGEDKRFRYGYGTVDLYALGQVSTGEYKALRITRCLSNCSNRICEVITIDADGRNHGMWRETQAPPPHIYKGKGITMRSMTSDEMKHVVVSGVVHFLIDFIDCNGGRRMSVEPGSIASFNLETEEWMPILRGPAPVYNFILDNMESSYRELDMQLSLADLQGCLVTAHNVSNTSLDLWYLSDFEKGLWVKKYSLPSKVARLYLYPLVVLDDRRIVLMQGTDLSICFGTATGICTYDLKTGAYTRVLKLETGISLSGSVGIYTGSLLSC